MKIIIKNDIPIDIATAHTRLACIPDMKAINNTALRLLHPKEPKADAGGNIDMAKYFGGYMNLFNTSDKQ